jgi:predicted kinase
MSSAETPLLVVVTGPPGAGKTTVARGVAAALQLPLIAKDTIKEALFEGLGTGGVDWSRRLGAATMEVVFALLDDCLRAGSSVVAEANFVHGESEAAFAELPPARIVQLHCSAPAGVLMSRYQRRERHPGHVDRDRLEDIRLAIESGRHEPLDLRADTIAVDTTTPVDVDALVAQVCLAGLWKQVEEAIVSAPGGLSAEARRGIVRGDDPPELAPLLAKVRCHAYEIVDDDLDGLDDDVALEAILAAAFGAADERRRAGLEVLR